MYKAALSKSNVLYDVVFLILVLAIAVVPADAQNVEALPLAAAGSYAVSMRELVFVDQNRDSREIETTIWYPSREETQNAAPDPSGAPYPLILYTYGQDGNRKELSYLTRHLASYGFVVAAMEPKGQAVFSPRDAVDRPLDVLFILDQLASLSMDDFSGVIDTDHAGVTGYSFGGYTSVAVSGARWDFDYLAEWCETNSDIYPTACFGEQVMDQVQAYRARFDPQPSERELWPPFKDERIRAVLPIAGSPGPVFGERGLAAATVPMLLMAGTADRAVPYETAGVFVYEHWGSSERYLLSFIGAGHLFGYTSASRYKSVILHFATAFFGYYLKGQADDAQYLTEDYVNGIDGLAWGPYSDKLDLSQLIPITPDNVDQVAELAAFEQRSPCVVAFSPDSDLLAGGGEGAVSLWDIAKGRVLQTLATGYKSVQAVAFSPDGRLVAATSTANHGDTDVRVWDVATGELRLQLFDDDDYDYETYAVAFSPDGTLLAVSTGCPFGLPGSAFIKVWDAASGSLLLDIPIPPLVGHMDYTSLVGDLEFSPDGTLLAAAPKVGPVTLWDVATGGKRAVLGEHTGSVRSVMFSPDGTRLASVETGTHSGSVDVHLWDVASREQLDVFDGHNWGVGDVAFSADGRLVVTAGGGPTLLFWDTTTGSALASREADAAFYFVNSVAFSADSTLLATCDDQMLRLWGVRAK